MQNLSAHQFSLASRSLSLIIIVGLPVAVLLGFMVTPDRLIEMGIMKKSLTSTLGSVKEFAFLEIFIFRGLCFAFAIILLLILLFKRNILNFLLRNNVISLSSIESPKCVFISFSSILIFFVTAIALLYMSSGQHLFTSEQLAAINREDGIIEYTSAILFFITGIVSLLVGIATKNHKFKKAVCLFFALLFVFTAGEEISWGQRIFGFETLQVLEGVNVQKENNIHNAFGYLFDHAFISFVFLFGFALPLLSRFNLIIRGCAIYLGLPIASMGLAFGFLAVSGIHDATIYKVFSPLEHLRVAEMRELLTSLCFLLLFLEQWGSRETASSLPSS